MCYILDRGDDMLFITEEEKRRKHIEVDKIMTEKDFFDEMKEIEVEVEKGMIYTEEEFRTMMKSNKIANNLY